MVVKVTKPEINVRDKLTELDRPVGIAGQAMMSAETPQEQFNLIGAGRRNLLINGGMQVWQRGISFSNSGPAYNADRWSVDRNDSGGGRSSDAPENFSYSLSVNNSTSDGVIRQAIELPAAGVGGVFRAGQQFTLSFYLKSDVAGEKINIFVSSGSNVNATSTTHVNDQSTGLTTSTEWIRYTYTFTSKDVSGGDTCYNIVPYVYLSSGTTYWTGVQLEVGKVATPFEHRSYGEELALCQRYYQEISDGLFMINFVVDNNFGIRRGSALFPQQMRTAPSATGSINDGTLYFTALKADGVQLSQTGASSISTPTISGLTFDAEL